MQHEPFAAAAHNFIQLPFERGSTRHAKLLHRNHLRPLRLRGDLLDAFNALGESSGSVRQLEDHVFDLPPLLVFRLGLAYDPGKRLKAAAPQPELAIERLRRQFGNKPCRCVDGAPAAKRKTLPSQIARTPSYFS